MAEPTSVEVWAPAFEKTRALPERLTAAAVFSTANERLLPGLRWCRLCESWVPFAEREEHVRAHGRERSEWRRRTKRERERDGATRLRQINRLKREVKEVALDRAPGDGAGGAPSPGGRPTGQTRRRESTMSTKQAEAGKAPAKEKASGDELFAALLERVQAEKVGASVVVKPDGKYARVFVDEKRHAGYIVRGKRMLNVFPQALAADMPKDLGFNQVKLGSHHYGRGEVRVPVESESDFGAAIKALKAAAAKIDSAPAEAKKAAPAKKRQAQPDPKPSGRKSRSRAAAAAKA